MNNKLSIGGKEFLKKSHSYHWLYGNELASHLPMAIIALDKLGGSYSQLNTFYHNEINTLIKRKPSDLLIPYDWQKHLGDVDYFEAYLNYFNEQLKDSSINSILNKYLPDLYQGIASYAFHALIRLAYGVEAGSKTEISHALAFWASGFQKFGEISKVTQDSYIDILLNSEHVVKNKKFILGNIVDRMKEVVSSKEFLKLSIQPQIIDLDEIAKIVIYAYKGTKNFTLLHAVTSTQAIRVILPFIENKEEILRYFWHTLVLAYLSAGAPKYISEPEIVHSEWDVIIYKVLNSKNSHAIKIVYSCLKEYRRTKDKIYLESVLHLLN